MKKTVTILAGIIMFTLLMHQLTFAQDNMYKLGGNNNGADTCKLGFTNEADLKLITNDSVRETITKGGDVIIEKNLSVKGNIQVENSKLQPLNINGDVTVNGTIKTDSIKLFRILPPDGDSIIRIGRSTININILGNRISWTPILPWNFVKGLTIANGFSVAWGANAMAFGNNALSAGISSMAFGNNVNAMRDYSFAIGNGVANWNANTFLLGFNSNTLFADATGVGINIVGHSSALDVAGDCNIRTVIQDDTLSQVLVRDQTHNGLIHWRDASTIGTSTGNAWELNGNPNATNFDKLGAMFPFINLNIYAGGLMRQFIDGTTGFAGMGDGFNTPQSRLHLHQGTSLATNDFVYTQWTNFKIGGATPAATNGFLVGIDVNGLADLVQQETLSMNFFTSDTERVTILANGLVGIGKNFTPNNKLDVDSGDIDVNTPTRCYMIHDSTILHIRGKVGSTPSFTNIFCGYGAGFNNTAIAPGLGISNSFFGRDAGFNNTKGICNTLMGREAGYTDSIGSYNTFLGYASGYQCDTGKYNTFVGAFAGYNNTHGMYNTFIGDHAGFSDTTGGHNTFDGQFSGYTNLTGGGNTCVGYNSGLGNITKSHNTYIGNESGHKTNAEYNTFTGENTGYNDTLGVKNAYFGNNAGMNNKGNSCTFLGYGTHTNGLDSLNNSSAIGANSVVRNNAQMILGDTMVKVGIGLSNDPTGPRNKLEIDYDINKTFNSLNSGGGTGFSGLQFRDLNAQSIPEPNMGKLGTLALDSAGNVIYVPTPVSNRFGAACTDTIPYNLPSNWRVGLGCHNFYFDNDTTSGSTINNLLVGIPCSTSPKGKIDVLQQQPSVSDKLSITINAENNYSGKILSNEAIGVRSRVYGSDTNFYTHNIGGKFSAWNSIFINTGGLFEGGYSSIPNQNPVLQPTQCFGISGRAKNGSYQNRGGSFAAIFDPITNFNSQFNIGVSAEAVDADTSNYGGQFSARSSLRRALRNYGITATSLGADSANFGGYFFADTIASVQSAKNYGIYAEAHGGNINYAGFFNGDLAYTGSLNPSDSILKENVANIHNVLSVISQLKPKQFNFKTTNYPNIQLPSVLQYGLISQQVARVLPNLVSDFIVPTRIDIDGKVLSPSMTFKGLNYIGLIPIAIEGIKELDSATTSLDNRLDTFKIAAANALIGTNDTLELGGNLIKNTAIGFNNKNLVFTDPTSPTAGSNTLSLGENPSHKQWLAKLNVYDITDTTAATFINDSTSDTNLGIQVIAKRGATFNLGGSFEGSGSSSFNCGVAADANSNGKANAWNYGGDFQAYSAVTNNNINIGVVGQAGYGGSNIGGMFTAQSNDDYSYGIWASAQNSSNLNFTTAGFFNGDVVYTGSCYHYSDSALKENVAPINNAMELISKINPKTYNFKTKQYPDLNFPKSKEYGLLAQELSRVMPELTETIVSPEIRDAHGKTISASQSYTGINYIALIPVLIAGMKEQQQSIIGQQQAITGQQKQIDSLITIIQSMQHSKPGATEKTTGNNDNGNEKNNYQVIELASENSIVLNQNDPNPFAEETDITYYLPEKISNAKIMFYDITGKIIKSVELIGTGNGTLHVYASNLSSGTYMYSLIADGKTIDSKKMVCSNK